MGNLLNIVTDLHLKTKRNYLERMNNQKVVCMEIAKKYDFNYWDGDRKYGYGGYKYMPGRWAGPAKEIIETYGLRNGSRVLDIGCGKGYLLHELLQLEPGLLVEGLDISKHALLEATELIRPKLAMHDVRNKLPYDDKQFDLVISLGALHNLNISGLKTALSEIERVGNEKYVMVESYRNEMELFNLQCWALTCESFFSNDDWRWLFDEFGYTGDYEFIYFE